MTLKRIAAIVLTSLLGATVGLVVGYFTSGYVGMSAGFYHWLAYPIDSWHWPILGAFIGGLTSLACTSGSPKTMSDMRAGRGIFWVRSFAGIVIVPMTVIQGCASQ
jgi:hypothetical protein